MLNRSLLLMHNPCIHSVALYVPLIRAKIINLRIISMLVIGHLHTNTSIDLDIYISRVPIVHLHGLLQYRPLQPSTPILPVTYPSQPITYINFTCSKYKPRPSHVHATRLQMRHRKQDLKCLVTLLSRPDIFLCNFFGKTQHFPLSLLNAFNSSIS